MREPSEDEIRSWEDSQVAKGRKIKREGEANIIDYPYIRKWEQMMGAAQWYIDSQLELARRESAPPDATFKSGSKWHTLPECKNASAFKRMGLPVPEHLWYQLSFHLHISFSTVAARQKMISAFSEVAQELGLTTPDDFYVITENHK